MARLYIAEAENLSPGDIFNPHDIMPQYGLCIQNAIARRRDFSAVGKLVIAGLISVANSTEYDLVWPLDERAVNIIASMSGLNTRDVQQGIKEAVKLGIIIED